MLCVYVRMRVCAICVYLYIYIYICTYMYALLAQRSEILSACVSMWSLHLLRTFCGDLWGCAGNDGNFNMPESPPRAQKMEFESSAREIRACSGIMEPRMCDQEQRRRGVSIAHVGLSYDIKAGPHQEYSTIVASCVMMHYITSYCTTVHHAVLCA